MKRSLPRLERLLKLRAQEEEATARALGYAIQDEGKAREALQDADSRVERCAEQIESSLVQEVNSAGTLRNLDLSVRTAKTEADAAGEVHRASEDKVETARDDYSEDRKERRILERLRDRVRKEKDVDEARQEQKETDDISQLRWQSRR